MSPIILVHGILTDQTWFNGFINPLIAAKVPYAIATAQGEVSLLPSSIKVTGTTLVSRIPALAAEFGATKVHIVAHSKGGLWSRYFLSNGPVSTNLSAPPTPNNFGVLSLITLDTPHNGTILADLLRTSIDVTSLLTLLASPEAAEVFAVLLDLLSPELMQIEDLTPGGGSKLQSRVWRSGYRI
jgi:triacylglycerol esterase/lipase EstA (alpha/beta hydrolase family)